MDHRTEILLLRKRLLAAETLLRISFSLLKQWHTWIGAPAIENKDKFNLSLPSQQISAVIDPEHWVLMESTKAVVTEEKPTCPPPAIITGS